MSSRIKRSGLCLLEFFGPKRMAIQILVSSLKTSVHKTLNASVSALRSAHSVKLYTTMLCFLHSLSAISSMMSIALLGDSVVGFCAMLVSILVIDPTICDHLDNMQGVINRNTCSLCAPYCTLKLLVKDYDNEIFWIDYCLYCKNVLLYILNKNSLGL